MDELAWDAERRPLYDSMPIYAAFSFSPLGRDAHIGDRQRGQELVDALVTEHASCAFWAEARCPSMPAVAFAALPFAEKKNSPRHRTTRKTPPLFTLCCSSDRTFVPTPAGHQNPLFQFRTVCIDLPTLDEELPRGLQPGHAGCGGLSVLGIPGGSKAFGPATGILARGGQSLETEEMAVGKNQDNWKVKLQTGPGFDPAHIPKYNY